MTTKRPVFIAAGAAVLVALLGGLASMPGPWYASLEKSPLTPPDWVFGPAWTLIYASCVVAGVIGWTHAKTSAERARIITLFFFNAVFNVLWSFLFFTLKRPDWALAEVFVLWISVASLIFFLRKTSLFAALLLVPYLAWVSFAAYLNYYVFILNGPFA
jgi:tryptophan-rich sensory protein